VGPEVDAGAPATAIGTGTNASNASSVEAAIAGSDGPGMQRIEQPNFGSRYMWGDGTTTTAKSTYSAPVRIAINEIDFRGTLAFVYYHQAMAGIAAQNSSEYLMSVKGEGAYADFAAGSPAGGFPITLIGSGFDGYDGNASTVRVRFATEYSIVAANSTVHQQLSATTADYIEVSAMSVTATQVIVRAPEVSLSEGDVNLRRGYPCWNPPCRRTIVTLAINGVDFVGRPEPLVFYFFNDPWRVLGLMQRELFMSLTILITICSINCILTWRYRFEVYERYLAIKYRVKNRVVYPIMFRD